MKDAAKKQAASRDLENMKFRQWTKGTKGKLEQMKPTEVADA
jgi:hypothetical protein